MQKRRIGSMVLGLTSGLSAAIVGSYASADERPCNGVRIQSPPGLPPAWASAVQRAREALAAPTRGCAEFEVTIEAQPDDVGGNRGIRLFVTAADGRRAKRRVRKPSVLTATIFGLVASVPEEAIDESRHDDHVARAARSPAEEVAERMQGSEVGLWLGLDAGGRISQPLSVQMADFEGRADFVASSWLLFGSFRYAAAVGGQGDDVTTYSETVIGLGAGRSFSLGRSKVDFSLLPSLAIMHMADADDSGSPGGGLLEFRVGLSVRWSLPVSQFWQITVTADSDIAPEGVGRPVRIGSELPPLPAWTGGVRIGALGRLL